MSAHERYYGDKAAHAPEESFTIEEDDVVSFAAESEYGIVQGDGKVLKVFKNGKLVVEMNGQRYETRHFELLRKAG